MFTRTYDDLAKRDQAQSAAAVLPFLRLMGRRGAATRPAFLHRLRSGAEAVRGDVSVKVAARFFRLSEVTIIRKCREKVFPTAYQLGDKKHCTWHIPAADILRAHPDPEYAETKLTELAKVLDL